MQKLWIIVPIYKGGEDVPEFCASLLKTTSTDAYSLVAVDDYSPDDSALMVRKLLPDAVLLRTASNSGYAGACNLGMRYALSHGANRVMLVNQDIRFLDGWIEPLLRAFDDNPRIAAVQPKILMYPDTTLINSCGNALHILGFGYTRGYLQKETEWPCQDGERLAYCSGAAVVYRTEALREVGLLDEEFFMYHEDSDLSWRLRSAGYECVVSTASRVAHRYEFSRSISKFYYIERNRLLIMLLHYRIKTLLLLSPLFIIWECGMLGYSTLAFLGGGRTLRLAEKLRGYGYFLRPSTWRHIRQRRKKSRSYVKISDHEIMELFTDEISFQDVQSPLIEKIANPLTRAYWSVIKQYI